MNIPTKYIETINLDYLEDISNKYSGHVYSAILENNNWKIINPSRRNTENVNIKEDNRVIYKEELDSWDIGIKNIDDLKEKFSEFKKNY